MIELKNRAALFVHRHLDVSGTELISHRRKPALVTARALFVWCVRWSSPTTSYPTIGEWLERDHSSIIHLQRKAEVAIERDREFARLCEDWRATERSRMEVPHACD